MDQQHWDALHDRDKADFIEHINLIYSRRWNEMEREMDALADEQRDRIDQILFSFRA